MNITSTLEPNPASWSEYGEWGTCSESCGEGTQERTRQCIYPDCWNALECVGSETETQACTIAGKACRYVNIQSVIHRM